MTGLIAARLGGRTGGVTGLIAARLGGRTGGVTGLAMMTAGLASRTDPKTARADLADRESMVTLLFV